MVWQAATGGCECPRRRASAINPLTLTDTSTALAARPTRVRPARPLPRHLVRLCATQSSRPIGLRLLPLTSRLRNAKSSANSTNLAPHTPERARQRVNSGSSLLHQAPSSSSGAASSPSYLDSDPLDSPKAAAAHWQGELQESDVSTSTSRFLDCLFMLMLTDRLSRSLSPHRSSSACAPASARSFFAPVVQRGSFTVRTSSAVS